MIKAEEISIVRIAKRLALLLALLLLIVLSGGYFSLKYSNKAEHVQAVADTKAQAISSLIRANPDMWMYQEQRLEDLVRQYPAVLNEDRVVLRDAGGNSSLAWGSIPDAPVMVRSTPLYDAERLVAYVEIAHSYRDVIFGTLGMGLAGLLLGAIVYFVLQVLPLRAVRALRRVNDRLIQGQDALRKSEERYRILVERSPEPVIVHRDGKIVFASTSAVKLFGATSVADLEGRAMLDLVHADFHQSWLERLQTIVDHGADLPMLERTLLKLDGTAMEAETKGTAIVYEGVPAIHLAIRDITERKRAEGELRTLSRAVEQSPTSIVITDRAGKIEYVNPYFEYVTGYTKAEAVGNTPRILKSGITPDATYGDLWKTISNGEEWRGEMCNRRKNGELYFEHAAISGLKDEHGEVRHYIAVKLDITERKQAEQALELKRIALLEAERELVKVRESLADSARLESVGRLAAGVAHEVKNPLMIIRLGVDYLFKQFPQASSQQILDDVRGAVERADNVIKELLDFAKQKQFTRRSTDINQVIDRAIHFTNHETKRRNIAIVGSHNAPLPPIYADPDRLVQVFVNLLSNAAHAIGSDGSIEIVARLIHLSERDLERSEKNMFSLGEAAIVVDIMDNGPGIAEADKKKLFEPFFTTKAVGEGSGLGLAVSRNIVSMHRGSIDISNRAEGGASALLMFRVPREHLADE